MLRTHTSAIAAEVAPLCNGERLLLMPGIVYRRDIKDKTHIGEPHQMDIWLISQEKQLGRQDLIQLVESILEALNLSLPYRLNETSHPYTNNGIEIEVLYNGQWLEIGECGETHSSLLPPGHTGLAMGLGLERLVMLIKGIDDIRILYNKQMQEQMQNLDKYESNPLPAMTRDISIKCHQNLEIEDVTELIENILGEDYSLISSCELIEKTNYQDLPIQAIQRWNMSQEECNMLIRLTIQDNNNPITKAKANEIRDLLLQNLIN